jgi:3-hydroxybutyryl-CoA dehydrogenase
MIVVAASDKQWEELTGSRPGIAWQRVAHASQFINFKHAGAFFSLLNHEILPEFESLQKPVFIHAVVQTLTGMSAPSNVYRINGWATFLNRTVWETAGAGNEAVETLFKTLHTRISFVKDEPGFIAARVIAMIINEAYFALEDKVSSKTEIDTAMKLGTNYPYGPFEWASLIGTGNILALLQKLYETDIRYKPSELLIKETAENNP